MTKRLQAPGQVVEQRDKLGQVGGQGGERRSRQRVGQAVQAGRNLLDGSGELIDQRIGRLDRSGDLRNERFDWLLDGVEQAIDPFRDTVQFEHRRIERVDGLLKLCHAGL